MNLSIRLANAAEIRQMQPKTLKEYRYYAKRAMGRMLFDVKRESLNHIRENPKKLWYRDLPSLPNKLTHRTGTLRKAIVEGGKSEGNIDKSWEYLRRKKSNTNRHILKTFHGTMYLNGETLIGKWSPYVRSGSAALHHKWKTKDFTTTGIDSGSQRYHDDSLEKNQGLKDAKRSIHFRIMQEHMGRPYLAPAFKSIRGRWGGLVRREMEQFSAWYTRRNR